MVTIKEIREMDTTPADGYEVTIEITQYCPNECGYCSSLATTKGNHIPLGTVLQFLDALKNHNVSRINISGGEPLANPDFYPILQVCKKLVGSENIYVYTNEIQNIVFNTDIVKEINVEANVCLHFGKIYIPKSASKIHLLKLIPQGRAKEGDEPPIQVSANLNMPEVIRECHECTHLLLQADGKITNAPCNKLYKKE